MVNPCFRIATQAFFIVQLEIVDKVFETEYLEFDTNSAI